MADTLCWDCKYCRGGCSWMADGIPVEGWYANKCIIKERRKEIVSYCVRACPNFHRRYKKWTLSEIAEFLGLTKNQVDNVLTPKDIINKFAEYDKLLKYTNNKEGFNYYYEVFR